MKLPISMICKYFKQTTNILNIWKKINVRFKRVTGYLYYENAVVNKNCKPALKSNTKIIGGYEPRFKN